MGFSQIESYPNTAALFSIPVIRAAKLVPFALVRNVRTLNWEIQFDDQVYRVRELTMLQLRSSDGTIARAAVEQIACVVAQYATSKLAAERGGYA